MSSGYILTDKSLEGCYPFLFLITQSKENFFFFGGEPQPEPEPEESEPEPEPELVAAEAREASVEEAKVLEFQL